MDDAPQEQPDFKADNEVEQHEPEPKESKAVVGENPNWFKRLLNGYWHHKKWTLPVSVLVVGIAGVFAVPATRYPVLALFLSEQFTVTVTDSSTNAPVSGVNIELAGDSKQTNSKGMVTIYAHVGEHALKASKTYYKTATQDVLVDVATGNNKLAVKLVATGRQVPVKVINKISRHPIPEAEFSIDATTTRSDLDGKATLVLPAGQTTQTVTLKADGYNQQTVKVQVTTQTVDANTFALVPTGRVYFLSNLSGKLDVVSTNLDGSDRKTVLAGTGNEDKNATALLATRDWQYLALISKRDGGDHAKLFLIATNGDKVSTIDNSAADFSLVGWSGHSFVYLANRSDLHSWQPGAATIKTFNADTSKSTTIATTNAAGTSDADATYETFLQYILNGTSLIYTKTWYRYPGYIGVSGQTNVLVSAKADGTGSKTLKSVDAAQYYVSSLKLAKPNTIYFGVYDTASSNPNYYRLDANGNITQSSTITAQVVNDNYPTYLVSPSGKSTLWTEVRDGKNTLLIGDSNGDNGNQITSHSDYTAYGWFSDDYVLAQKNDSELYILSANDFTVGDWIKLSDYFKPDYYFYGYGGGYGGL